MICFDVYLNDRRLCRAGVGEYGQLSQYLSWTRVRPEDRAPYHEGSDTDLALVVTGLRNGESLHWVDFQEIAIGDQITVRVLEASEVDTPSRATARQQRESARETRHQLYLALKREFESGGAAA